MNDLKVVENNVVVEVETDYKQVAVDYLKNMGMQLPTKYMNQFVEIAKAYGLNPFKREIYAVGYGQNFNIIVGYEVYLKRAERTGLLDGWEVVTTGEGEKMESVVTIWRKDHTHPHHHKAKFSEFAQRRADGTLNAMWKKMPSFMLEKVAIAQGFRLYFSEELGGMPYTSEELKIEDKAPETTATEKYIYTPENIKELEQYTNGLTESQKRELRPLYQKVPFDTLIQKAHELTLLGAE